MQSNQAGFVVYQPHNHGVVHFNSSISRKLGIIQILAGAVCIICNIVGITLGASMTTVGYGIWGGAFVSKIWNRYDINL